MCQQCASAIELFHKSISANTRYLNLLYDEACEDKRKRQISIIGDVDEQMTVPAGTSIVLKAQTRNKVRITAALIQVSSAGILTIGNRVWNLAAGLYPWFGLHWILQEDDVRTLTQQASGLMSLELMGESLVDTGVW